MGEERLLSATEAGRALGVPAATARWRAKRALEAGEPGVTRVGRMIVAPVSVWERVLLRVDPQQRGPRRIGDRAYRKRELLEERKRETPAEQ